MQNRKTRSFAALTPFAIALMGASCKGGSITGPQRCLGQVTMTVTAGTTPQFSWTPACPVGMLFVFGPGGIVWVIGGAVRGDPCLPFGAVVDDVIAPSVVYGMLPPKAVQCVSPQPLQPGNLYTVQVSAEDPDPLQEGQINVGSRSFTP